MYGYATGIPIILLIINGKDQIKLSDKSSCIEP